MKIELELDGMSCNHCKMTVDETIAEVEGIEKHDVEIGRAVIDVPDWGIVEPKLRAALEEEGYPVVSANPVA